MKELRTLLLGGCASLALWSLAMVAEAQALDPAIVGQVKWRSIGPASMGGRVNRIIVEERNPTTWYVATASGGLWKTTNGGESYEGLFQNEDVNSIGDVAVSKSHPNVVWIGSGEHHPRNSSIYGKGMYKSEDGGKTWKKMGLEGTRHIGRIAIHPTNPNIVYVGAMGRTWGKNEDRGMYKTTDGGKTWKKIHYVDDQTGVIEVQMHPTDPNTLLMATWQRQRDIYDVGEPAVSDGPGSGIWKTTDGGTTWKKLGPANGLPEGSMGRTGIDYYKKDPNIVYLVTGGARLPSEKNGVWKSTDGGENWTKVNNIAPRPMYYSQIRVDPTNPDAVYVLGVQLARSEDGGKSFSNLTLRGVHVDHHALWINPADPKHVLLGNDGGIWESKDRASSFNPHKKMALGQFYHVAVDNKRDYSVAGGLQDNGTWYGPSMKRGVLGPVNADFRSIGGGDGFVVRFHPEDPNTVYLESQNGNFRRVYLGPAANAPRGRVARPAPPQGERETWAWKTDFILSPHDPNVFLTAGEYVYLCQQGGTNLKRVSPRLALTPGGSSTAIAKSPADAKVIYAGTDDGALWVSRDGGSNWTPIHDNVGMPLRAYVSTIEPSRYSPGRVYVAFDAHRSDDERPFLYVSEDYGQTWKPLNANLPEFGSTRALREDTKNPNLLFCGTEFFTYASIDRGQSWTKINNNLPTVAVHDFAISDAAGELVAATHGRSLWATDITWLRQLTPSTLATPLYFFEPHSAVLWDLNVEPAEMPKDVLVGENPDFGATFTYRLSKPAKSSRLTIEDWRGNEVKAIEAGKVAGVHRTTWDMTVNGQKIEPGVYLVTLDIDGVKQRRKLVVERDPNSQAVVVRIAA